MSLLLCTHYFDDNDPDWYSKHLAQVDAEKIAYGPQPLERYHRNENGKLVRRPIGAKFERIPHLGNQLHRV